MADEKWKRQNSDREKLLLSNMLQKVNLDKYNVILMDLWGVVFDGKELYPQVYETLKELNAMGKKIVFFSNVPRRAKTVAEMLKAFDIDESLYAEIISSGELVYETLEKNKVFGERYLHLGSAREILNDLKGYEEVFNPQDADFSIITSVLGKPGDNISHYDKALQLAGESIKEKLPLLCVNPDKISITKSGKVVYCPGMVTEFYEKNGGEVIHFGKPHSIIYKYALNKIAAKKEEILAIGDSIANDIIGAKNMDIDSLFICSGIHRKEFGTKIGEIPDDILTVIKKNYSVAPKYVLSLLRDLIF